MSGVFDHPLFSIGDTPVTIASLIVAVVIAVGSLVLGRLSQRLVSQRLLARTQLSIGIRYVLGRFTSYLVFFLGVAIALQTLGIRATTLAAFGAALGVGIGFGLQDIVKNFVAGLVILIERPIQIGDSIEIGDVVGDVTEIRARATVVRTNDDVSLIVPNSKFISDTVVNRSFRQPRVRYRIPVTVAAGSDLAEVETALLEAAGKSENVLRDPPPRVWFDEFGERGLRFALLCWTSSLLHNAGAFRSEINRHVYDALKARGIALPSPQLDVRLQAGVDGSARPVGGGTSFAGPSRGN